VLHHFYPYFDVIDENWDAVLDDAIDDVLDDNDAADLHDTLERLVARLHDGHGRVSGPLPPRGRLPVSMMRVDGTIVVLAVAPDTGLMPGDEIVALDGDPIAGWVDDAATRVSGSPQWIEYRLLENAEVTLGPNGSTMHITAERATPGGPQKVEAVMTRGTTPPPRAFSHPTIERFSDGVYYVDLDRASWPEIEGKLDKLAKAPGVVFDLRGYPNSNHQILTHLLTEPDSARWMFVPRLIYPRDDPDPSHRLPWYEIGWDLAPQTPQLSGRIAFITGPGAISYAESVLGYVQGYRLGAIVGATTAGANGNVNPIQLPGGFAITWTGMKVTRFDGTPHHGVGIAPTIAASPSRAGLAAGRDEVRDVALAYVRTRE
jgi:C-terminal processing protease CtpA/Prc